MKKTYAQHAVALGTNIELRLVADTKEKAEEIFRILWQAISAFDQKYSRFLPDSIITKINQAAGKIVSVDQETISLLTRCKKLTEATNGLFNPFVLPAVQQAGYLRSLRADYQAVPTLDYRNRRVAEINELIIKEGQVQIPADSALDVGGIGKGYLADQLAKLAQQSTPDFCFSIGGDIALGGTEPDGADWPITVAGAEQSSQPIGSIKTANIAGIATSGATRNFEGKKQQHEIDPTTGGLLHTPLLSCTVMAKNATLADVCASVSLHGEAQIELLLQKQLAQSVLAQYKDGTTKNFGETLFIVQTKDKLDIIESEDESQTNCTYTVCSGNLYSDNTWWRQTGHGRNKWLNRKLTCDG